MTSRKGITPPVQVTPFADLSTHACSLSPVALCVHLATIVNV